MKRRYYIVFLGLLVAYGGACLFFAHHMAFADVTTNTTIKQDVNRYGRMNLYWDFEVDALGAAVVRTKHPVQGLLYQAIYIPDADVDPSVTTFSLSVIPVATYNDVWYEETTPAITSTVTATTSALTNIPYWPTNQIPLSTETQFEVQIATETTPSLGGRLWFTVINSEGAQ